MKNVFTSLTAILLVVWYSLSVIGFDVHTCSGSGKAFIATVVSGTGCDDIHPEHNAPCCECCQSESSLKDGSRDGDIHTKPCCTDNWQVIALTGVRTSKEEILANYLPAVQLGCNPALVQEAGKNLNLNSNSPRIFYRLASGSAVSRPCQEIYSVWRI